MNPAFLHGLLFGMALIDDRFLVELGTIDPLAFGYTENSLPATLQEALLSGESQTRAWFAERGIAPTPEETVTDAILRTIREHGERRRVGQLVAKMPKVTNYRELRAWLAAMQEATKEVPGELPPTENAIIKLA